MNNATPSEPQDMRLNEHSTEKGISGAAQEFVSDVAAKVSETTQQMGKRVEAIGKSVRRTVSSEGAVGGVVASAANTFEGAGAYLQEVKWENMVEDLTNLIRRYPLPSLLIGLGVGYLLARNTK